MLTLLSLGLESAPDAARRAGYGGAQNGLDHQYRFRHGCDLFLSQVCRQESGDTDLAVSAVFRPDPYPMDGRVQLKQGGASLLDEYLENGGQRFALCQSPSQFEVAFEY